jgi:hypothetical protein
MLQIATGTAHSFENVPYQTFICVLQSCSGVAKKALARSSRNCRVCCLDAGSDNNIQAIT